MDYSDFLYLVVDTNVLLIHLRFLDKLKDCNIKGIGKPVLVIPWMVLQELDKLKKNSKISCGSPVVVLNLTRRIQDKYSDARSRQGCIA